MDQARSLLTAANSHGDLTVKLSSLKQAKDVLLSLEPSLAAELFPSLVELQYSPEGIVRQKLVEVIEEIGLKAMENCSILIPVLLALLRDNDSIVARESIVSGTHLYCGVLEEMALQRHRRGKVERWLEGLWIWMIKFKEAVFAIALEPGPVGIKLLALKFLETYILLFTTETNDSDRLVAEGSGSRQLFNISWVAGGHPVLDPVSLMSDANKTLVILLDFLWSPGSLPGALMIAVFLDILFGSLKSQNLEVHPLFGYNEIWSASMLWDYYQKSYHADQISYEELLGLDTAALVVQTMGVTGLDNAYVFLDTSEHHLPSDRNAVARKRPLHYGTVLSALLDFDPKVEKGCHAASIQYSLRTAFLGFLRCTYPTILESRDKLLRALRAMNAGDAAEQAIRQVDKMIKYNERTSREVRFSRDDQPTSQLAVSGDQLRKRCVPMDNEEQPNGHEMAQKRIRYGPNILSTTPIPINDSGPDSVSVNGVSANVHVSDSDLTPAEQMIAMIGALLAEGERGAESLELLISNIHPDLLADIVITNMKHLPKSSPPLTRLGSLPVTMQNCSLSSPAQLVAPSAPVSSAQGPFPVVTTCNVSLTDTPIVNNFPVDSKRDPRRDPRRLDPRRTATSVGVPSVAIVDDHGGMQPEMDDSVSLSKASPLPVVTSVENPLEPHISHSKIEDNSLEGLLVSKTDQVSMNEEVICRPEEIVPMSEANASSDQTFSPPHTSEEGDVVLKLSDFEVASGADMLSVMEPEQLSPDVSNISVPEEICQVDLPQLPPYIELTEEQQNTVRRLAVERVIESYKHLSGTECIQTRMALLARLVAQINADDDIVVILRKHVLVDYQQHKGHEVVLHFLYHLHSLTILDSVGSASYAAVLYEKFLLVVAKSLLDAFPASDKSFSKLLGEVPFLPESAFKLLDDLCQCDIFDSHGKEVHDGERVTQGLGAVWSLILGRPNNRLAFLDIALKCAVHSQDDIRSKAIRLVANKLYQLNYISQNIEQFATNMLLSAVEQRASDINPSQSVSTDQVVSQEVSVSCSQVSETGNCENDSMKGAQPLVQSVSTMSFPEVQRHISLFFALCTKNPSLLQTVFDIYGQAPKTVKQAVHRHIPVLIRALGSSYSELLRIISDPPEGCENLLMLILTQETTPSANLITTVKHLYETKLEDATILIPILSSLSKNEVLPIFPRLVGLPIEKFQMALAHILQGSAHTGPALTPAEVLVAIHDISPNKDGLPLKKITDACSACFEQRTVFTQQVLAKALNQMVDQTPLPLLFMRTVIQAIDAFPSLVDFVMEILSKLVSRQVWKMPKLWVGFLKCVSQTRPHSFHVLLQLPPSQLESALSKHANLRGPLATYANQANTKTSLPRSTLAILGLVNEQHMQQLPVSSLHPSSTSSSAHGANTA
uniref:Symplekin C-terminal domain-containing protein n=1 Tax=Salix viminalis TaxID=40686 RepID=A0A6N2MJC8_SALVM